MLSVDRRDIISLSGFKLMLFIDTDEYMGMLSDSLGAIVTVHPPFMEPNLDENTVFVTPGSAVYVSVHAVSSRENCFQKKLVTSELSISELHKMSKTRYS